MTTSVGIWSVSSGTPVRGARTGVDLEKNLEDWIEADPTLLAEGLQVVGRQVHLEAGFLDLLGIDVQGRWVVIELKRSRLHREAVSQALDYAASLAALDRDELAELLGATNYDGDADAETVSRLQDQLDSEDGDRDIRVVLVGTGVDPGLERVVDYLGRYDVPISAVTFQVFELNGEHLLVREVVEEHVPALDRGSNRSRRSVADIQSRANREGVGQEFGRIIAAAEAAGLYARPYVRKVMVAPPSQRHRFLLATGAVNQDLHIGHSPEAFAEFFPDLTEADVIDALGEAASRRYRGEELEAMVSRIEQFLADLPPAPSDGDDPDRPHADAETVMRIARTVGKGEWTTYADVSIAAIGRSSAAQAVGYIARNNETFPNPHRILNQRGHVPSGWIDEARHGPEYCQRLLEEEGVQFSADRDASQAQRVTSEELAARAAAGP